jgi:NADH dehydrogenase
VVAGGGFAGVETIAAVNDFVRDALKFYPNCQPHHVRMVLVHPGSVILPELGEKLGAYAQKKLAARKLSVLVRKRTGGPLMQGSRMPSASRRPAAHRSRNHRLERCIAA